MFNHAGEHVASVLGADVTVIDVLFLMRAGTGKWITGIMGTL